MGIFASSKRKLSKLIDVNDAAKSDGRIVKWDDATGKHIYSDESGGGGGGGLSNIFNADHGQLNITITAGGAPVPLIYNNEVIDTGGDYTLGTGIYLTPALGIYEFGAQIVGAAPDNGVLGIIIATTGLLILGWAYKSCVTGEIVNLVCNAPPRSIAAGQSVLLQANWTGAINFPLDTGAKERNYFTGRKIG